MLVCSYAFQKMLVCSYAFVLLRDELIIKQLRQKQITAKTIKNSFQYEKKNHSNNPKLKKHQNRILLVTFELGQY